MFRLFNKKDYIYFFLLIPLLLLIIFLIPEIYKYNFYLITNNPSFLSIFLSNYNHNSVSHIIGNLALYFLFMMIIFGLESNKKRFYMISIFGLFIFPFLIYLLRTPIFYHISQILINFTITGFSGIISYFLGYLLFLSYKYLNKILKVEDNFSFFFLLFMLGVLLWIILTGKIILLIIGIFCFIYFIYLCKNTIKLLFTKINFKKNKKLDIVKRIVLLSFLSIFMILLIPLNVMNNGLITDTITHFFGYLIGIFSAFIFNRLYR